MIARDLPAVSEAVLRSALVDDATAGYDANGNARISIEVAGVALTLVVDEAEGRGRHRVAPVKGSAWRCRRTTPTPMSCMPSWLTSPRRRLAGRSS